VTDRGESSLKVIESSAIGQSAVEGTEALGVAEVVLAPLAAGEYVLELAIKQAGEPELITYGFRIVP